MREEENIMEEDIVNLAKRFDECRDLLTAIGDSNRLHIMIKMMQMGECNGVRVGKITNTTHLSRPAVSHHLQILKNAGILKVHKDGTKNYYYFDSELKSMKNLIEVLQMAVDIAANLPKKREFD